VASQGINQPPPLSRSAFRESRRQPPRACSKQLNEKLGYLPVPCTAYGNAAQGAIMFKGLYKVEFKTPRRKAVGVVYAADGKLHGGSSAFAYVGSYTENGNTITGVVCSMRHTNDPNHPSAFGFDKVTIECQGTAKGEFATFEGTATETPSLGFKAVLTRIAH
jgi:hypothetical protein